MLPHSRKQGLRVTNLKRRSAATSGFDALLMHYSITVFTTVGDATKEWDVALFCMSLPQTQL
jgi:hypothetical protein